ncbi:zinc finger CCCH domain-containing protein 62-like isoform X2 [Diospyros lotus]|uniref:zinc finger CCCH domain-containing protein 62-like isoform X2 n=1 Tax=Diospyros lotus TaxID=55363 RepID=UPI00224E5987|nr:zinc finger CCCH domain-containing protein 62-like isoform X2 [Diospyros lotus]
MDYDESDSDDLQDPRFDAVEETQSLFSALSVEKKAKSRIAMEMEEGDDEVPDVLEVVVPELDEPDQKSFEAVEKVIQAGHIEKLKVDQCKIYLRKHRLRLMGNKDTLIARIREHLDILRDGGEKKYPMSSFVLSCKGDACTGDVVMFEQNIYEMFNIASRSASGPPCGKRIIAGRIVKESYGAAKQQHTFTIEVLWSKGEKPLPPLHPLLIKGRNLYRLKTMRQRWENESEREKILAEKHTRGSLARSSREARIQEKEMKKKLGGSRATRMKDQNIKQKEIKVQSFQSLSVVSEQQKNMLESHQDKKRQQESCYLKTGKENTSVPLRLVHGQPDFYPNVNVASETIHQKNMLESHQDKKRQQESCYLKTGNENTSVPLRLVHGQPDFYPNVNVASETIHQMHHSTTMPSGIRFQESMMQHECRYIKTGKENNSVPLQLVHRQLGFCPNLNLVAEEEVHRRQHSTMPLRIPFQIQNHERMIPSQFPPQRQGNDSQLFQRRDLEQREFCRFYAQGRCYYGDRCKYRH